MCGRSTGSLVRTRRYVLYIKCVHVRVCVCVPPKPVLSAFPKKGGKRGGLKLHGRDLPGGHGGLPDGIDALAGVDLEAVAAQGPAQIGARVCVHVW